MFDGAGNMKPEPVMIVCGCDFVFVVQTNLDLVNFPALIIRVLFLSAHVSYKPYLIYCSRTVRSVF